MSAAGDGFELVVGKLDAFLFGEGEEFLLALAGAGFLPLLAGHSFKQFFVEHDDVLLCVYKIIPQRDATKAPQGKSLVDASLEAMDFLDDAAAKEQISLIDRGDLSRGYRL